MDILNGTKYERSVSVEIGGEKQVTEQPLIRERTNLSHYKMMFPDGKIDGIKYSSGEGSAFSFYYTVSDAENTRRPALWKNKMKFSARFTEESWKNEFVVCDPCAGAASL